MIGVFALQGAFAEHERAFSRLGEPWKEIRSRSDLTDGLDGIVLPGGESTVQGKLLREKGLEEPVRRAIADGMPVFGTCAGMILLAKTIVNDERRYLAVMDVAVRRNAYGRQLGSFRTQLDVRGVGTFPAVFIRAPYVERTEGSAEALAVCDGKIVAVRQGHMLATAFHPELTDDLRLHSYFAEMTRE